MLPNALKDMLMFIMHVCFFKSLLQSDSEFIKSYFPTLKSFLDILGMLFVNRLYFFLQTEAVFKSFLHYKWKYSSHPVALIFRYLPLRSFYSQSLDHHHLFWLDTV